MAINATVTRISADGTQTPMSMSPAGGGTPTVYIDDQGNYFTNTNGRIVNIGDWGMIDAAKAAGTLGILSGKDSIDYRAATGLASGSTGQNGSAKAVIKAALDQWQLGSLTDWAWGRIVAGASEDEVLMSIRDTDAYKQRFGNTNAARLKKGLVALSENEILSYEKQAAQMLRAAGLPAGFYDSSTDFAGFLANDVSLSELNSRVQWAKKLAVDDPSVLPEEAKAMRDLYGLGDGDLAAYILDPTKAAALIEKQVRAAANAAAARVAGFSPLSAAQAERISGLTSSTQEAAQGLQQLAHMREVFAPLPGERESALSTDTLIEGQFGGNVAAQQEMSRRQRARVAAMESRQGTYATGKASTPAL